MLLTAHDAEQHATAASPEIAAEIVQAGLAVKPGDVVRIGNILYARARLPSGDPAAFYLNVGTVQETPPVERLETEENS